MNLYKIKRNLLAPYIWYMRRKERHQTGFIKAALELHYYRPVFYRFIEATMLNPDILYEAPNINSESNVIDVGGFSGEWSARVFEKYQPTIYCFELEPSFAKRIKNRFQSNSKIHCFDYGLSRESGSLKLMQKGMGSTLYAESGDAPGSGCTIDVQVRDIVEVLDELHLNEIDLVKLNIEGGEYDVLERMIEADRLKSVKCLMVQFHEWLDAAYMRRYRIRKALSKTHRLVWDYSFVWEQWVRK